MSEAARWLTTPLMPDDFLELLNPLCSSEHLRGRVLSVQPETSDAATLVVQPGRGWCGYRAGQYVGVGVDVDGVRHWRTFSLSSSPHRSDGCVTITVKAVPGGFVTQYLVREVRAGTIIQLTRPQGRFVLPEPPASRLLFVTAGSGITPVMGMLRSLSVRERMPDVVLVHCAPRRDEVIFGAELRALAGRFGNLRLHEWYTRAGESRGRLSMARLAELCPDWAERETWVCGPAGMLDAAEAHWRQAGLSDRLRVERFHPMPAPAGGGVGGRVRFHRSQRETHADGGTPLLAVGEAAGVLMPSGCRMGICHRCLTRLRGGRVRDLRTGQVHGEAGDLIQTCVSAAAGPVEVDL